MKEDPSAQVLELATEDEPFHSFDEVTTTLRRSNRLRNSRQLIANEATLNGIQIKKIIYSYPQNIFFFY